MGRLVKLFSFKGVALALAGFVVTVVIALQIISRTPTLHTEGAVRDAVEAYIYGYPLVTFDMARMQQTNVEKPDEQHAPVNQMIKMRTYLPIDNHCCAAPNADTLYTIAWLDVYDEPWILSIPEIKDRYYIVPLLDGFSEVIKVISSINDGSKARHLAITGPGWSGTLPDGVTEVKSSTAIVWMLGRIYSTGTPADYKAVNDIQERFKLVPLSAWGKPWTPPPGVVDPDFDMKTAARAQINSMDVYTYFNYLAHLLKTNPPRPQDADMVEKLARIGLVPGEDFDPSTLRGMDTQTVASIPALAQGGLGTEPDVHARPHLTQGIGDISDQDFDTGKLGALDQELIKLVPRIGLLKMALRMKQQPTTNGWLYFTEGVGNWGNDYLLRGMGNLLGPGWNRPEDAVYPISMKDADGDAYDGSKYRYVMHFEKGGLPPVDGFWSLTMYDKDLFFVPNTIDRYNLSQRDSFVTNPDGSIDLYLQADSPGKDRDANWLPAPNGEFKLVLRVYGPSKTPPSILDGSWAPPPVQRVE
jgi:hypothetical protein